MILFVFWDGTQFYPICFDCFNDFVDFVDYTYSFLVNKLSLKEPQFQEF